MDTHMYIQLPLLLVPTVGSEMRQLFLEYSRKFCLVLHTVFHSSGVQCFFHFT